MKLEELNVHAQKIVQQVLQYLTHDTVPICNDCGFAHGVLDLLIMGALEEMQGNFEAVETLFQETLESALALCKDDSGLRSFDPNDRTHGLEFFDACGFCEECGQNHSIFDIFAAIVLCGLKTKEELEQEFSNSIEYLKQFIQANA